MIILTTGLMRTGTSLVSRWLHEMNVPMGTSMRFPFPNPKGQIDFEDIEFTDMMFQRLMGTDLLSEDQFVQRIQDYEESRLEKLWGVKSPFALPFINT